MIAFCPRADNTTLWAMGAAQDCPIAIVGVAALFPGSADKNGFWRDILAGRDLISDVPPSHWRPEDYLDRDPKSPDRVYSARGGFLSPVAVSPRALGVAPTNLEATDSSQLLGLVVAVQALADCGYTITSGETGSGRSARTRPSR